MSKIQIYWINLSNLLNQLVNNKDTLFMPCLSYQFVHFCYKHEIKINITQSPINSHVSWTFSSQGYGRIEVDFISTAVNLQELSWVLFLHRQKCSRDTKCKAWINSNKLFTFLLDINCWAQWWIRRQQPLLQKCFTRNATLHIIYNIYIIYK